MDKDLNTRTKPQNSLEENIDINLYGFGFGSEEHLL